MACIETSHQNAARRSTYSRAGIEISKPHPVLSESINMWGLDKLLTIAAQVTIAKVICHDVYDVRFVPSQQRDTEN